MSTACQNFRSPAKTKKITIDIEPLKKEHLHVFDSAAKSVCYDAFLNVFFAQTEVGQLYVTLCVKQNIFGLQITIDYAQAMQMLQGQYNFAQIKAERTQTY